ncbi:transposase [Methyloglobulus sp.]|uniref:transposase n=1 Tax=Methyloglobulus sp. TaxID=2518622 RepID=UPI0032B7927A
MQELADHHPYADFRRRALGIPAFLGKGHSFCVVADIFGVTLLISYNWAKAWRTKGLVHLPPYSPGLNPIEIVWKHLKYYWRRFVTWSKEELFEQMQNLMAGVGSRFKISFS